MNLDQIATRIAQPESCPGSEASALKELAEKYPFAQVFSILYLKALSNAQDIGFDEALQKHAYRVTDRMKLYDLIHGNAAHPASAAIETTQVEDIVTTVPEPAMEGLQEDVRKASEEKGATQADDMPDEVLAVDPDKETGTEASAYGHDELAETMVESGMEVGPETEQPESKEEKTETAREAEATEESEEKLSVKGAPEFITDDVELEIISQVVATVYNDNLDRSIPERQPGNQQETPEEEKKEEPLITHPAPVETDLLTSRRSFSSWLKAGHSAGKLPGTPDEEPVAPEEKVAVKQVNKIIDEFIEKEPSISRPKKEFYSPAKKAKESISSDGILYTETLADIFAIQGNFPKAIQAYEQLMLTNPEKKIFFAQRIKELKEKLNT